MVKVSGLFSLLYSEAGQMPSFKAKEITAVKAIELLGTNRNTFYKWAKEEV